MSDLERFVAGEIGKDELGTRLAPGCKLETKTEKRTKFEAGEPVRHQERDCGRVVGCDDSYNNSDWSCGDWRDT